MRVDPDVSCADLERDLDDLLDGRTAPARVLALGRHLRTCPACARLVREAQRVLWLCRLLAGQV